MRTVVEVRTCRHCDGITVAPKSDRCAHCLLEYDPVGLVVPQDEIVAIVVKPTFVKHSSWKGVRVEGK
jgi:hypothetical protein